MMTQSPEFPIAAPGLAFDEIAQSYDEVFTRSVIGSAQRRLVWKQLDEVFRPGDRILELNCGTGEDALYLGKRGMIVEACDASAEMIGVARKRKILEAPDRSIQFRQLATEEIGKLKDSAPFDGVLSNFAGLNCVGDLDGVGRDLTMLVRKGGRLVFCLANRICLWEIAWLMSRGEWRKAYRRVGGRAVGRLAEHSVNVWYPTLKEIEQAFSPWFELRSVKAVGLTVPPSYLEFWASKHPGLIGRLAGIDEALGKMPMLRELGDHVLLRLERVR